MTDTPAYKQLGFHYNPFGTLDEDQMLTVTVLCTEMEELLQSSWDILEIIGDKGAGKTLYLHYLKHIYQQQGLAVEYEHLENPGQKVLGNYASCRVFFLDEAQRARRRQLVRILGKTEKLVTATHESCRHLAPSHRHFVSLSLGNPSLKVFRRIVIKRLDLASAGQCDYSFPETLLQSWLNEAKNNLHIAELIGYEWFQNIRCWDDMTPRSLERAALLLWRQAQILPAP
ncbi:hypothetical protein ACFL54_07670 [Planctomycetota bacterium]